MRSGQARATFSPRFFVNCEAIHFECPREAQRRFTLTKDGRPACPEERRARSFDFFNLQQPPRSRAPKQFRRIPPPLAI